MHKFFKLKKSLEIGELQCQLHEYEHEESGALVMHIEADDPENLFCLSFQTFPSDSKGAAHILEHTVLCGSKKFPIKDPFFAMTRRSLNTFMNALTGADFTCYPAATQVEKDYFNLLEVYLDAVFHPELKKISFLQEGHRLEFVGEKLEWKGIVFNEMKGAFNSGDTRMWHEMMKALMPDLTYAHVSGGDPKVIPELTYEELKKFHETYYHPSRCLFFFYGNFPIKPILDFIHEKTLKGVKKVPPLNPIPFQRPIPKPVYKTLPYPINEADDLEEKNWVALGWLTTPVKEQKTVLALTLLDTLLMESDASPLKAALLKSKLCTSADGFIDTDMSQLPYVIVCRGAEEKNADALEQLIRTTLKKLVKDGFLQERIDAALHQLEFSRLEIGGEHGPFGLTLFMRSALAQQHGCPPENALQVHTHFNELKKAVENKAFLPGLIEEYFLGNTQFCRLVMKPDPELLDREAKEEEERLRKIEKSLTPEMAKMIREQTEKLSAYQKKTEAQDIECLPQVTLGDVPVLVRDFSLKMDGSVFHHVCFTNHIVYADLVFDLPPLAGDDLIYTQLITGMLPELGAGKRGYVENLEYLQAHTGGVAAALALNVQAPSPELLRPSLMLRGKALHRKAKELMTALYDISRAPRFDDRKRIEELLLQIKTGLQTRLTKNAMRYATQLATSGISDAAFINNMWNGLPFYQQIEKGIDLDKLEAVARHILAFGRPAFVLSSNQKMYDELKEQDFYKMLELAPKPEEAWISKLPPKVANQARPIASPVAFTCKAYAAPHYLHPHSPALHLATQIMENKVLHPKIREQGGAYGSGATFAPITGHFSFFAYRDPNIASTLKTFDEAIDVVARGEFTEKDLVEAKLGVIQQFDTPIAPGSRALISYSHLREGRTTPLRQKYRDTLLGLSKHEVARAVEKELLHQKEQGIIVTLASEELIGRENKILEGFGKPLPIIPILS